MKDEQFISAMHQAVAERGANYTFESHRMGFMADGCAPAYQTPGGEGACLIGYALLIVDRDACPASDVIAAAESVLIPLGISAKVAIAARVAQIMQDSHYTWGDCIWAFDWAIENHRSEWSFGIYATDAARLALAAHKQKGQAERIAQTAEQVDKITKEFAAMADAFSMISPPKMPAFAQGGIVTGYTKAVPSLVGPKVNITFVGDPAPPEFVSIFDANKVTYSFA